MLFFVGKIRLYLLEYYFLDGFSQKREVANFKLASDKFILKTSLT